MKLKGFTLAEVLITLMIIGIVAALTIPSVISNYQQQEFKTGLKKAVSVLNEAIQTNIALDGETPYENSNLISYLQRHMNTMSIYSQYGNLVFYTTDGMRFEVPHYFSCTSSNMKLYESGVDIFEARIEGRGKGWCSGRPHYSKCGSYGLGTNPHNTDIPPCFITVDVNGDKKPNPKYTYLYWSNGELDRTEKEILFPSPTDKKLTDVFNILITDEKAIPFGVVAQRAMYSK